MATWNGCRLFEHLGVPYIGRMPTAIRQQPRGTRHQDDATRYTWGQCHALAMAILRERPEWALWGVGWEAFYVSMTSDEVQWEPGHVLVSPDDGESFLDVEGLWLQGESAVEDARPLGWDLLARMVRAQDYSMPVLDGHTLLVARELIGAYEEGSL